MGMQANEPRYGLRTLTRLEGYTQIRLLFHDPISYTIYIFKYFLLLVPYSHQGSTIMLLFSV
jgi:hypothetical protein